jgi:hypothetical protein
MSNCYLILNVLDVVTIIFKYIEIFVNTFIYSVSLLVVL